MEARGTAAWFGTFSRCGNGALPELQGQGYGGLAFYQTFLGWAQSNFSETYDLENPFFDNEDGYSAIDPDLELSCAQLLAAGQNPLGCNEILQSELDFVTYMAAADNLLAQLGQPAAFKRTVPIQLGGLIQDNPVVQESVAFYANVFYDLSDDTKLTFGYRVNEDKYDDYAFNALGDVLNADYRYSPVYDLYTLAGTVEESNEAFRTKGEDTAETFKFGRSWDIVLRRQIIQN